MKLFRRILSCFLIVSIMFTMASCGSAKSEIKSLMKDFEKACNAIDANAMLDCINPKVADTINAAVGIIGLFTSKTSDELIETVADVIMGNSLFGTKDFFTTLSIKVETVNINEDSANGTATVTYKNSQGEKQTKSATFKCVKNNNQWYISSFSID